MVGSVVTDLLQILSSSPPGWILPYSTKPIKTNKQTNPELSLSLSFSLAQKHTTQGQQILPTSEEEEARRGKKKREKTKKGFFFIKRRMR
jgi:hypothetical protein